MAAKERFVVEGSQYQEIDGQMMEIKRQLRDKKGSVLDPEKVKEALQNIIEGAFDGVRNLRQLIATGKYGYVNPNINEKNFPKVLSEDEYTLEEIHLGKNMGTEEALDYIKEEGLEPADLYDLAEYGADNPNAGRKYPIVELGSVWADPSGGRDVACLYGDASVRRLGLDWFDGGWDDVCRFLVRRKKSA